MLVNLYLQICWFWYAVLQKHQIWTFHCTELCWSDLFSQCFHRAVLALFLTKGSESFVHHCSLSLAAFTSQLQYHVHHKYFKIHFSSGLVNNSSSRNTLATGLHRLHNGILNLAEYYLEGRDSLLASTIFILLLIDCWFTLPHEPSELEFEYELNCYCGWQTEKRRRTLLWVPLRCTLENSRSRCKRRCQLSLKWPRSCHCSLYLEITFNPGWALRLWRVIKSREHPC